MRIWTYERYGSPDVLELTERELPEPTGDQVLVTVHSASLNAYDWHLLRADPFLVRVSGMGFFRPKNGTLGADIAGTVERVGNAVTELKPGDAVFGTLSPTGSGGFAEYALGRERYLAPLPKETSFAEAAAIPMAATTALQGLRDVGSVSIGKRVAINGASGGVGTFAVQIAKALGADVTAICSTGKVDQARALGADHVIDYTAEDFTKSDIQYDMIFGVNGFRRLSSYKRVLKPQGIYVMAGGSNRQIFQGALFGSLMSKKGGRTFRAVMEKPNKADLMTLAKMIESGAIRPVIDRTFPFDQVPDAIRYLEEGHAAGKIVVSVADDAAVDM